MKLQFWTPVGLSVPRQYGFIKADTRQLSAVEHSEKRHIYVEHGGIKRREEWGERGDTGLL